MKDEWFLGALERKGKEKEEGKGEAGIPILIYTIARNVEEGEEKKEGDKWPLGNSYRVVGWQLRIQKRGVLIFRREKEEREKKKSV